jgi:hypothetical protein
MACLARLPGGDICRLGGRLYLAVPAAGGAECERWCLLAPTLDPLLSILPCLPCCWPPPPGLRPFDHWLDLSCGAFCRTCCDNPSLPSSCCLLPGLLRLLPPWLLLVLMLRCSAAAYRQSPEVWPLMLNVAAAMEELEGPGGWVPLGLRRAKRMDSGGWPCCPCEQLVMVQVSVVRISASGRIRQG